MTLISAPPSEDLESKVFRNCTILRTPSVQPEIKLVLFKESSYFSDSNDPAVYKVAIEREAYVVQVGQKCMVRETIEELGIDEQHARQVYTTYQEAMESGKAYLIDDEEKGLRLVKALDNK